MRLIVRNFALVTGTRALDGAVRFLTVPIVLGHFGKLDFGLIALAFSMQGFLTIMDFGLSVNAVRRIGGYLHDDDHAELGALARAAAFFYTLVGVVNFVALLLFGWYGAGWFDLEPGHALQFFWMMAALGVASVVTWASSIYRQILQAAGQAGWDEAVNLASTLLTVLAIWATLRWNFSPAIYFALVLLPLLVPTAMRVRKVRSMIRGFRVGFNPDWSRFKPLVGASLWLFMLALAEMAASNLRPLILAREAGLESVTDFRVLQQIAGFALLMLSGVMSVVYPSIARLDAANNQTRIDSVLATGSRLLLWAHLGLLITMAFTSDLLLRLYVGVGFVHLAPALVLSLMSLVAYHNAILTSLVIARGQLVWITVGAVINAFLSLALLQYLARGHGVFAAIWSYTAYIGLQLAVMYLISAPAAGAGSGMRLAGRVFTRPVLGAVVSVCVAVLVVDVTGLGWWTGALVFAPVFALCALTVGGVGRDWVALRHSPA